MRLFPYAVNQLFNIPADEVANEDFDFSDFLQQEGADLADQLVVERRCGYLAPIYSNQILRAFVLLGFWVDHNRIARA